LIGEANNINTNNRNWYVAYTAPRAEKKVAQRLEKIGIDYYLPLRKQYRQWSDRKKMIHVPAFTSYIFVKVNQSEYYTAICQSGMVRYIYFDGSPAIINEKTMEEIRRIFESDPMVELCDHIPTPGEKYIIPSGPLKGIEGKIIRLKGNTHFILEVKEWGKYLVLPYSTTLN